MTHWLLALLCLPAFACLALSQERHQQDRLKRSLPPATQRRLRGLGWVALLIALTLAVHGSGWVIGLVQFSGHTSLSAGLVFGALVTLGRRDATRPLSTRD